MIKNSRFAKVAVSAGLIVASGAAVLGLTSFASAKVAGSRVVQVQVSDTVAPRDKSPASPAGVESLDGGVSAGSVGAATDPNNDPTTEATSKPVRFDRLAVVAKTLGMTEADLVTELRAGKSIADVAKDRNVELDKVIAALTSEFKAHLDEEVKSGAITREVADAKLVLFTARTSEMVNVKGILDHGRGMGGHAKGEGRGKGRGPRFMSENLAKTLKLSAEELKTQLRDGKSLAEIAKAQGVDVSEVKDALAADFKAHLDEEVKSGEHTQAEADAKLAEFKTRLDDMVNGVRPARGPGMGDHNMGGHGKGGHGKGGHRHGDRDGGMPGQPGGDTGVEGASFPA